jgi:hypothetical protein
MGRVIYGSRIGEPNDEIDIIESRGVLAPVLWRDTFGSRTLAIPVDCKRTYIIIPLLYCSELDFPKKGVFPDGSGKDKPTGGR